MSGKWPEQLQDDSEAEGVPGESPAVERIEALTNYIRKGGGFYLNSIDFPNICNYFDRFPNQIVARQWKKGEKPNKNHKNTEIEWTKGDIWAQQKEKHKAQTVRSSRRFTERRNCRSIPVT